MYDHGSISCYFLCLHISVIKLLFKQTKLKKKSIFFYSDRKYRKKQRIHGQNGSLKILDGIGDHVKDRKITSSGSKTILQEQV